jgi:uncharacterized surface protein with fasciclin (FAS1) repeats
MLSSLLVCICVCACTTAPQAATPVLVGVTQPSLTQTVSGTEGLASQTPRSRPAGTGTPGGRFSIFLASLQRTGLQTRLRSGGPYTIFVPPDTVIDQVPEATRDPLFGDPDRLTALLEYHIVQGKWTLDGLYTVSTLPTLEGKSLTVTAAESGGLLVNGAAIHTTNLKAANFTIYSIDALLIPPS